MSWCTETVRKNTGFKNSVIRLTTPTIFVVITERLKNDRMPPNNKKSFINYNQNKGKPGVVYILANPGLAYGHYKIGCSTISGYKRATDLNSDAGTGTPGTFRCIFECNTKDCGEAEERVFKELQSCRKGKYKQEFFKVDSNHARSVITRICSEVDESRLSDQTSNFSTPVNIPNTKKYSQPLPSLYENISVLEAPSHLRHSPQLSPRQFHAKKLWRPKYIAIVLIIILLLAALYHAAKSYSGDKAAAIQQTNLPPPKTIKNRGTKPVIPVKTTSKIVQNKDLSDNKITENKTHINPVIEAIGESDNSVVSQESSNHHFDDKNEASELSLEQRRTLESVCLPEFHSGGSAAYNKCRVRIFSGFRTENEPN